MRVRDIRHFPFLLFVVVLPCNFRLAVAIDSQTQHCHHHHQVLRLRRGSVLCFSFPIDTTPSLDDDGQSVMFRWRVVRDKPVAPIISSLSAKPPPFFSNVYLRKKKKKQRTHTHTYIQQDKKKSMPAIINWFFQEVEKRKKSCVFEHSNPDGLGTSLPSKFFFFFPTDLVYIYILDWRYRVSL